MWFVGSHYYEQGGLRLNVIFKGRLHSKYCTYYPLYRGRHEFWLL
jgi:hypothetical protein